MCGHVLRAGGTRARARTRTYETKVYLKIPILTICVYMWCLPFYLFHFKKKLVAIDQIDFTVLE